MHWYMSAPVREFYKAEFIKEMRAHFKDGHYELLPSEAAANVAARCSVTADVVLMAFLPDPTQEQCNI